MDPSSGPGATGINKIELKNQELVVGAWRFELQTSCAQGRRATRLRYAPTVTALRILKHYPTQLLMFAIVFTSDYTRMGYCTVARWIGGTARANLPWHARLTNNDARHLPSLAARQHTIATRTR
jgi:hypothetical protein